jgi:hypothetical protein
MIKKKYHYPAIMRELFNTIEEPSDNYTDILGMDWLGEIGELSGDAGFKEIKTKFEDVSGRINMFGAFFKVNRLDEKLSKVSVVAANMEDMVTAMRNYYQTKCLEAWYNISGHDSFTGSKWSDATGDAYADFNKAINHIVQNSGVMPDTAIMNFTTSSYLSKFKEYREWQYLGRENLTRSGMFQQYVTPNGLTVMVIPDAIASTYIPDLRVIVTKRGACGTNHTVQGFGFQTEDHKNPDNPLETKYFAMEMAKPVIDKRDATRTSIITVT